MVAPAQKTRLTRGRYQQTDSRPLNDVQRTVSDLTDVSEETLGNVERLFELATTVAANTLAGYDRAAGYLSAGTASGASYFPIGPMTLTFPKLYAGQTVRVHSHFSDWNTNGGGSNSRHRMMGPNSQTVLGPTQFFPNTGSANRAAWDQIDTFTLTQNGSHTFLFEVQGSPALTVTAGAGFLFEVSIFGVAL